MFDYAGVIHLHSTHSDGTGTVPEIARAGCENGLDYVLLTDHDTLAARKRGEEGWYGGTLLIAGVEVTPGRGDHTLAFGVDSEIDHTDLDLAGICQAIEAQGGFAILAHPFSAGSRLFRRPGMPASDLTCDGFTGVELWSLVTDTAERFEGLGQMVAFIRDPLRVATEPPPENIRGWEALCRDRPVVAIGGLDAHQVGLRIGNRVPLRLMSYRRSFRHLRTHVLSERAMTGDAEADRATILDGIRAGSAYMAMDSLAPARGFAFEAREGEEVLGMGETGKAGDWTLTVRAPRPAHLRLVADGEVLAQAASSRELSTGFSGVGAVRAEAFLQRAGRRHLWALSNPVYLR